MTAPQELKAYPHDQMLSVLARADAERLKAFAGTLIVRLGEIEVIESRTGLMLLPMQDSARGVNFHLGEVLMSEARIRAGGVEAYGLRRGRDLEAAMAMALVDLAVALGLAQGACAEFLEAEDATQRAADDDTLRRVEATRVDMETF